jgi:MoxR-like ATPase
MATKTKLPEHVEAMIPPKVVAKNYVSRNVNGIRDIDIAQYAMAQDLNILLKGPTGPGKTFFTRAIAAELRLPWAAIDCHGAAEPGEFIGHWKLKDGNTEWVDGDATIVFRHGGVLLIDEVNFMQPRIAAKLHPALDARRYIKLSDKDGEVVPAHQGKVLIVAAYNPDYIGTFQLNEAFKNRFAVQIEWDYDPAVEEELVASPTLRSIAMELRRNQKSHVITTPVSTNKLQWFELLVEDVGLNFAIANFIESFSEEDQDKVRNVLNLNEDRLREAT